MKLISKVTEIYCIADDFCKEYELELNKKALSLSNSSPPPLKLAIEREELQSPRANSSILTKSACII